MLIIPIISFLLHASSNKSALYTDSSSIPGHLLTFKSHLLQGSTKHQLPVKALGLCNTIKTYFYVDDFSGESLPDAQAVSQGGTNLKCQKPSQHYPVSYKIGAFVSNLRGHRHTGIILITPLLSRELINIIIHNINVYMYTYTILEKINASRYIRYECVIVDAQATNSLAHVVARVKAKAAVVSDDSVQTPFR